MLKSTISILVCMASISTNAQPYVDVINVRYSSSLSNNKGATSFTHLYVGSDLPFKLKNNKLVVLSPFFEQWNIDSINNKHYLPAVSSITMALSAIIPLNKNHWSLTATAVPRFNSEALQLHNSYQMGGVLLATYKKRNNLKYKLGVYVNSEFFGLFVMPLAGIDWKINEHNYLFGVLPGRLTYEHQLSYAFYTGATFRAVTNSYRLNNSQYLRIDDNQTSAYLDWYAAKHLVFSGEMGYGIMRKLRTGFGHNKNYNTVYNWDDGLFFRLSASYRIRLKS